MSNTPTDAEIDEVTLDVLGYAALDKETNDTARMIARAVLAKWGTPQPSPVGPPAPRVEPVAWLNPWRADQVTTDYDAYGRRGIPLYTAPQPVAREPLTGEQIQDLLLRGNPTDEEMRLIRIGWDAAHGIKGGQHGTK